MNPQAREIAYIGSGSRASARKLMFDPVFALSSCQDTGGMHG